MGPSLKFLTVAGIPVRVHWTFFLLLGWFLLSPLVRGSEHALAEGLRSTAFVLAVFACVVLHEFGHALAARAFGVQTRDVTLLPIGGVARLERMPERPTQELVVALAGPAVNVLIAIVLVPPALALDGAEAFLPAPGATILNIAFLPALASINIFLAVFNLIPAFPMDGGRVLRAVLAMSMNRARATSVAAGVGQALAIGFALLGLVSGNVLLMLVAVFVFLGAGAEAQATRTTEAIRGATVADAMVRRFRVLHESDTLSEAAEELISGEQHDFPVLRDGAADDDAAAIVGVLPRGGLIRALASGGLSARVGDAMEPSCPSVAPDDPLERALELSRGGATPGSDGSSPSPTSCSLVPVVERISGASGDRARLVGMVTSENVMELVAVRSALRRRSG